MTDKREIRILLTGGGTGGHVSPALAVVQKLREMAADAPWRPVFRYVGSAHGIEKALAEEAGIEFVGVQSGKLRRARTVAGLISRRNIGDLFRIPVGIAQAMREVGRFRPDVIFATGGYVSVPPVIAGWLRRTPILIHEQTVQVGLANRIAARCASRIALTYEEAASDLPRRLRSKTFVSGNPVREIVLAGDAERAVARFGFADADSALPAIYITGGAQGASRINGAVEEILPELVAFTRVIHQCGRQPGAATQDIDGLTSIAAGLSPELRQRYYAAQYIKEEIGDVFALADLVVGRSGAATVAEICAVGRAALFIPLVPTGGDEQTRNARLLESRSAAAVLPMAELSGPSLLTAIRGLVDDRDRLRKMGRAAKSLATPQAAGDLARALLKLAGCRETYTD